MRQDYLLARNHGHITAYQISSLTSYLRLYSVIES